MTSGKALGGFAKPGTDTVRHLQGLGDISDLECDQLTLWLPQEIQLINKHRLCSEPLNSPFARYKVKNITQRDQIFIQISP